MLHKSLYWSVGVDPDPDLVTAYYAAVLLYAGFLMLFFPFCNFFSFFLFTSNSFFCDFRLCMEFDKACLGFNGIRIYTQ